MKSRANIFASCFLLWALSYPTYQVLSSWAPRQWQRHTYLTDRWELCPCVWQTRSRMQRTKQYHTILPMQGQALAVWVAGMAWMDGWMVDRFGSDTQMCLTLVRPFDKLIELGVYRGTFPPFIRSRTGANVPAPLSPSRSRRSDPDHHPAEPHGGPRVRMQVISHHPMA